MRLIFEDYFNNLDNWNFEQGFIRNYELQYYTNQNVELINRLRIYGKKEYIKNNLYDSSSNDWKKIENIQNLLHHLLIQKENLSLNTEY